ncbi:MAG: APC family permease [Syntrophobacteraceae bacterium]
MADAKNIGFFKLTGLCIGPILGSGIVFLPSLAIQLAGQASLAIWILLLCIGFPFAYVCARLVVLFPSPAGLTGIVARAFGSRAERLAGYALLTAIICGPVVVMKTAGAYVGMFADGHVMAATLVLMLSGYGLLLCNIKTFGTIQLISSSVIAILLLFTSIFFLPHTKAADLALPSDVVTVGKTLLVIFWALVGWEIVGNYSAEVENPDKIMPWAVVLAFLLTSAIFLLVAYDVQFAPQKTGSAIALLPLFAVLFHKLALAVATVLIGFLCFSTFVMVVGAGARLIASLAESGHLPHCLAHRFKNGSPFAGIAALGSVQLVVLLSNHYGFVHELFLVKWADTFCITNILIILISGMRMAPSSRMRAMIVFLAVVFSFFALFMSLAAFITLAALLLWHFRRRLLNSLDFTQRGVKEEGR